MSPNPLKTVVLLRLGVLFVCAVGLVLLLGPFHLPNGLDKVAHVAGFYGFTLVALAALPWNRKTDILLAAAFIALSSEAAQAFTGRNMSLLDMAADVAGVAAAGLPIYVAEFRAAAQRSRRAGSNRMRTVRSPLL